ncbi:hypothetical protein BY996DRAFT_7408307 [Phakopsora pachyrhizi]|nr:hypothetical protein BY996DRAFT_7408307 [Phakopsora pachyrhizi]
MSTKRSFSNLDRSVLLRPTDQHLSLHSTRPITKRSSSRLYTSKVDSSNFFYNQHRYSSSSSSSKNSDSSDEARRRTEEEAEEEEIKPAGLFGKVRQLSKLYGSAALVIYGVLSAFDFGLSFLMIYLIGTDHVRTAEDYVIEKLNLKRINPIGSSDRVNRENGSIDQEQKPVGDGEIDNNMIWTTAILAYTIHKTVLLPVRVGLTAWITPPIVRALRRRGWKIGKQKI